MSRAAKTLEKLLRANADASIPFGDLCSLLLNLGFVERIRGDHHIFTRDGVAEILNLQPRRGKAKPYQVKQVRGVITTYGLAGQIEVNDPEQDGPLGELNDSRAMEENDGE